MQLIYRILSVFLLTGLVCLASTDARSGAFQQPLSAAEQNRALAEARVVAGSLHGPVETVYVGLVRQKKARAAGLRQVQVVLYDYADRMAHYLTISAADGAIVQHQVIAQHFFPLTQPEIRRATGLLLSLPTLKDAVERELQEWYGGTAMPELRLIDNVGAPLQIVVSGVDSAQAAEPPLKVKTTVYRPAAHHSQRVQPCRQTRCVVLTLTLGTDSAGSAVNLTTEPVIDLVDARLVAFQVLAEP